MQRDIENWADIYGPFVYSRSVWMLCCLLQQCVRKSSAKWTRLVLQRHQFGWSVQEQRRRCLQLVDFLHVIATH